MGKKESVPPKGEKPKLIPPGPPPAPNPQNSRVYDPEIVTSQEMEEKYTPWLLVAALFIEQECKK